MSRLKEKGKTVRRAGILLFWLAVWFLLAFGVDNEILLVTPSAVLRRLLSLWTDPEFYRVATASFLRIAAGFVLGFAVAVSLAVLSKRFAFLEELLAPVMRLIMAVPVASFVVLLLIWWGASFLSVAICVLVVLPNIYVSTLEGLKNVSPEKREMAEVFGMSGPDRFFYICRPTLKPFLESSMHISLGMSWKSGVAAEIIGTPDYSVGEQIYLSKIYLDTAGVFAWTAVVILLSVLFERGIVRLTALFFAWQPRCRGNRRKMKKGGIVLEEVTKRFGEKTVWEKLSTGYEPDRIYYLTSPSGSGKTTLLRLIAGLEKPDEGGVRNRPDCGMLFQEDRLCEEYSAVKNVEMVTGDAEAARKALLLLLTEEDIDRPCAELSGGMKRRVALVRAMEAASGAVLLDEPYTGMDENTRERARAYIRKKQQGRVILIATHI